MRRSLLVLGLLLTALTPVPAHAVKVADITRMAGARTNVLTGMGLVIGLHGTGDGGAYLPAIKPLAALLRKFGDPASLGDLSNANNMAVVMVTATLPKDGVRKGEPLDVEVSSIGAAASLRNGRLYMAQLLGPTGEPYTPHDANGAALRPIPFALANGPVDLEDASVLTNGVVKGGAVMEVDLPTNYVDRQGRFTLILDQPHASWQMATAIENLINQSADTGERVAVAVDTKDVVVLIPAAERAQPAAFIARVLRQEVPVEAAGAEVRVNDRTGTMIITGDVEVSPTVICHKGLTITTTTPAPPPPQRAVHASVPVDTTGSGGARLQDLADAFDQLKVPAEDRIEIVKELYETGKLHAKLIVDGYEK